ncbi:MAG: dUTP diphosphatase [Bdellovibrionales bacterium]|nr:dUTP diphosphatase [Bdellovibrionales bacterium]
MIKVKVNKVNAEAQIPVYMSTGAAGCDVQACTEITLIIKPGERAAIPTGLSVEIPEGYEIQVRPRSGLAFKKGLTVVNSPGTIDSDYRGEIKILVINLGLETLEIKHQDRIAQLVLQKVDQIHWEEVVTLKETVRGTGGFGSTGVSTPT